MLATKYLLSIIIDSGKLQQGYIAIMLNSLLKFILVVYDGVCEPYVLQTAQNNGTQSSHLVDVFPMQAAVITLSWDSQQEVTQ